MRIIPFIVALVAASPLLAQSDWSWSHPIPQGNRLHDVVFTSELDGVAVGDGGSILRTSDAGATWEMAAIITDRDLYSVSFVDPRHGIIVGDRGVILRSDDSGGTWRRMDSLRDVHLSDVAFGAGNVALVVDLLNNRLLHSTNGGGSWRAVTSLGDDHSRLWSVEFVGATTVLLGAEHRIYRSSDAGLSWSLRADTLQGPIIGFPARDSLNVAAVPMRAYGTRSIYRTSDGGMIWTATDGSFADSITGIASAGDSLLFVLPARTGYIYRSSDRGASWDTIGLHDGGYYYTMLSAIAFASETTGVIVGAHGDIYRTTDRGLSWRPINRTVTAGRRTDLRGIACSREDCIAVGEQGTILRSHDGGRTWSRTESPTTRDLNDVIYFEPGTALIVGDSGTALGSADGGATWRLHYTSPYPFDLVALSNGGGSVATAVGDYGIVLATGDGGWSWEVMHIDTVPFQPAYYNHLHDVDMIDRERVFAVGANGLVLGSSNPRNGWDTMRLRPHVPAALTAVEFADSLNGSIVWTMGGGYATVYVTTDGGISWEERVELVDNYRWERSYWEEGIADLHYGSGSSAVALGNVSFTTGDRGVSWRRGLDPPHAITAFTFTEDGALVAVGENGTILRAEKSGVSAVRFQDWFIREMMLR